MNNKKYALITGCSGSLGKDILKNILKKNYEVICHSKKISCLPRIPDLDNALIIRLLDSGADGIIAPSIENVEQIEFLYY